MTTAGIALAIVLFVFLAIFTLLINPPEAWVRKVTDRKPPGEKKP